MAVVTHFDKEYSCTTAIKGGDYVHLLNEDGEMIVAFDGVTDFSSFSITSGSWTTPTPENECYVAVVKDDGTMGKGGHKSSDILPKSGGEITGSLEVDQLLTAGHMHIGNNAGPYLYTGDKNFVIRYGDPSAYHFAEFKKDGPLSIDGNAVSMPGHTHKGSEIQGQVALADTAQYLGSENMKLSLSSLEGHTGMTAWKNGMGDWALCRYNDNTAMATHYYDANGNWQAYNVLLNHENFQNYVTPAAIGAFGALGNVGSFGNDLNSFTQQGAVLVSGEVANRPSGTGVYGICWNVFGKANTYLEQHYVDAAVLKRFVRYLIDGTWREWAQEYDSLHKPSAEDIGAAPQGHTHPNITDGVVNFFAGSSTTPLLSGQQNGKTVWAIERGSATSNHLKVHYYDSNGVWTHAGEIVDSYNLKTYVNPATIGAQPALGYAPIQNGGGAGQGTNKIYIGWASDGSGIKAQVDTTDMGYLATIGAADMYSIVYSPNEPRGVAGKIWLKPVQ